MRESVRNPTNTANQPNLSNASAPVCCRQHVQLETNPVPGRKSQDAGTPSCHRCRLSIAFHFIDQVTLSDVTEEAVADVLGVSPSRLRHLWKGYLGIGFRQYMIRMRLERARELICVQGLSMKAAAAQLEIDDLSHFYRDFKRRFHNAASRSQKQTSRDTIE